MVKSHKSTTLLNSHLKEGHRVYTYMYFVEQPVGGGEPYVSYASHCITCLLDLQFWAKEHQPDPTRMEAETLHG